MKLRHIHELSGRVLPGDPENSLKAGSPEGLTHHRFGQVRPVALCGKMRQYHRCQPGMEELHGELGRRLIRQMPMAGRDAGPHRRGIIALVKKDRIVVRLQDQHVTSGEGMSKLGGGPPQIRRHPQLESGLGIREGQRNWISGVVGRQEGLYLQGPHREGEPCSIGPELLRSSE